MMFSVLAKRLTPLACLCTLSLITYAQAITLPAGYDAVWTTQSNDSAGSMPVGGGDIGLNAWAENGDILLYMAKSGTFDENNSLLKLGRVRLSMAPNPFAANATPFEQRLSINDGHITFTGASQTVLKLWVDVFTSVIHVDLKSSLKMNLTASYETWRTTGYTMKSPEQQETSWGIGSSPRIPMPYQYPDTTQYVQNGVLNYHHNYEQPLFNFQMTEQNLSAVANSLYNPMKDNTFGMFMTSPQLIGGVITTGKYISTNYTAYNLVSKTLTNSYQIYISTAQNQTTDIPSWQSALIASAASAVKATQTASINWWHQYWDRSYIIINPNASTTDAGFQVGKNYQYFRYMMGCNAFSSWPTRFNGGLFTFDPILTASGGPFTPDWRRWSGGTFTAQNQRLLYWPMLKSGDYDLMKQQFDFYKRITPNNRLLGRTYFGIDATVFSEQMDNTGLPNAYEYDAKYFDGGPPRAPNMTLFPPGIDYNDWINWIQDTANEFADMILQANLYSGFDVAPYLDFIEYQLAWFDEYYRQRNGLDSNGKLIIYPGAGAETYKFALNPGSTASGLRKVIKDLLAVNPAYVKGNKTYYESYLARVPDTPLRPCPGATGLKCLSPAQNYSYIKNNEPTALYAVFPWDEYSLGLPTNISYALNAYYNDSETITWHGWTGWRQDAIWLARLGSTSLATAITTSRLTDSTNFRFSAFKGPNYDWSPDMNHYGSAAIGLQEMLMQNVGKGHDGVYGKEIRLLPSWPTEWTGYFKLRAPDKTVVKGQMVGTGEVEELSVRPASRSRDVVMGQK